MSQGTVDSVAKFPLFVCEWSHKSGKLTHQTVTLDPLCSLYRVIQTGPAQVDVLAVVVRREQLQQAGQDHVVVIIHVAEPPTTQTHRVRRAG